MTQCFVSQQRFWFYAEKQIAADFSGGRLSSDAGLLPLREFDQRHNITASVAAVVNEARDLRRSQHHGLSLLRQRVYPIIAGYEDCNDAQQLRHDPIFQLVADHALGEALASQPTLSRWENEATARDWVRCSRALLEVFARVAEAQVRRQGEIILDLDSTEDRTHGQQEFSFYTQPFGHEAYHPLLLFERHTGYLLAARLRPGNTHSSRDCVALVRRVLIYLRQQFPDIPMRFCADAAFPVPALLRLLEHYGVSYSIGRPTDAALRKQPRLIALEQRLLRRYQRRQIPQLGFTSFHHCNKYWKQTRRICCKVEQGCVSRDQRFVITNLAGPAAEVFAFHQQRGGCENRIAEFKNGFAGDRLSCHRYLANGFRLLLHALAYNLVTLFRLRLPQPLRSLQIDSLRLRLFKIAAQVRDTVRRVRVAWCTGWPFQATLLQACAVNTG